jgi:MarR family transcriptional regulator, 2-MHQ and catechol-resistance regulon repressor
MDDSNITTVLLAWSSTFIRLSLHDFNRFTRTTGLTLVQMNVLLHLYYQGPIEAMTFCEMMQISPAGASQMIERMVHQGVLQRAGTPGDRRVRLVSLTEKGRQVVLESIAARQVWVDQLAAALSPDERTSIAAALQTLNERAGSLEIHPT